MNLRPLGDEPNELPTAPPRDIMVPKTGIEPVRWFKHRRILSPVRLPVPPLRHAIVLTTNIIIHYIILLVNML